MGFQVLMGASFYQYLLGLLLGHLYIAIKDIYLPRYHKDFLPTPRFLYNFYNAAKTGFIREEIDLKIGGLAMLSKVGESGFNDFEIQLSLSKFSLLLYLL